MVYLQKTVPQPTSSLFYLKRQYDLPETGKQYVRGIKSLSGKRFLLRYDNETMIVDKQGNIQKIDYSPLKAQKKQKFGHLLATKSGGLIIQADDQYYHYTNNQWVHLKMEQRSSGYSSRYNTMLYFSETNIICYLQKDIDDFQVQSLNDIEMYYQQQMDLSNACQADDYSLVYLGFKDSILMFFDIILRKKIQVQLKLKYQLDFQLIFDNPLCMFFENHNSIFIPKRHSGHLFFYHITQEKLEQLYIQRDYDLRHLMIQKMSTKQGLIVLSSETMTHSHRSILYDYKNKKAVWDYQISQSMCDIEPLWSPDLDMFVKKDYKVLNIYEAIKKNKVYIHLIKHAEIQSRFGTGIVKEVVKVLN